MIRRLTIPVACILSISAHAQDDLGDAERKMQLVNASFDCASLAANSSKFAELAASLAQRAVDVGREVYPSIQANLEDNRASGTLGPLTEFILDAPSDFWLGFYFSQSSRKISDQLSERAETEGSWSDFSAQRENVANAIFVERNCELLR